MDDVQAAHQNGFYSRKEILSKLPISNTTLWRMIRAATFPAPVSLSPGRVGWSRNAVDSWIASKTATQTGEAA
jgi:predicted DNA-binding transcriptional regulator AlpA